MQQVVQPRESPPAVTRKNAVSEAKEIAVRFSSHRCTTLGASIAFYSAFSLAPTLLIVLAVAGWFFGADAARGELFAQMKGILGSDAAAAMQDIVGHARHTGGSGMAAVISVVLLAVGASATFTSLNTALDVVFEAETRSGIAGFALLLRARLMSFGLVMGLGFLMVVSLVLDAAIQFAGHAIFGNKPVVIFALVLQSILALVVLTVGFAALIKWLPDVPVRFGHALVGAVVAAVLFTAGRYLFGFYLSHAGTANAFGAAGSLAVLMMWIFLRAGLSSRSRNSGSHSATVRYRRYSSRRKQTHPQRERANTTTWLRPEGRELSQSTRPYHA